MQTKIKKIITIILIVLVISLLLYLLISQVEIFQAYAQDTQEASRLKMLGRDTDPNLYWKPCPFCYKHKDQVFYVYFQFNCPGCGATPAERCHLMCPICYDSSSSEASEASGASEASEARD